MAPFPTAFQVAQVVGITGSAWLAGNIAAVSLISISALVQSGSEDSVPSATLARQWKHAYNIGKTQNPPIAVAPTAAFAYLAWSVRSRGQLRSLVPKSSMQLYAAAAIFTIGIVPYTILAMTSTNSKLEAKAKSGIKDTVSTEEDSEVEGLLERWIFLNGIRSLFPLAGAITGLLAALIV